MRLRFRNNWKHYKILTIISLCSIQVLSIAGELKVNASVAANTYAYETRQANSKDISNQAIVVLPSLLTSYSSKRLLTSFKIDHTKVEQRNYIEGADKNYTDYKYNADLALILNTLNLSIRGQQGHRAISQEQEFITDKILSAADLTKFNNNSVVINFAVPNHNYFGLSIQGVYSEIETGESIDDSAGLDGDNTAASIQLFQGKNTRNYTFNFAAQHNNTTRTNLGDFKSSLIQGSVGISIAQNMSFILTANNEDYGNNQDAFSRRTSLGSTSYGAGIQWQPRNGKLLKLTYNQLEEEEGENEGNFVGVNLDWAFSNRINLKFNYGKKFYGDAYSLDFSHALKSVRSTITYSEQVTSFGRLQTTINPIGLFVCPFGSFALSECFQADSTTYQLKAGEEFRTLSEIDSDISEEIIFTKAGSFNLAYQKRRIKVVITASYRKTEYLESDQIQTNHNIRLNLSYMLSRRTNLSFSNVIGKISNSENVPSETILNTSVTLERMISKKLQINAGIRIIDRDSEVEVRNIKDKRLTVGLNYNF
ncbi:MAG: hypothetical protein ACI9YH_000852 [Colwellia sp.]